MLSVEDYYLRYNFSKRLSGKKLNPMNHL
jgi:hypothetical protein